MNILEIPELSLVVLIGASGSGKSSFARKHFKVTEVLSSDFCRGIVSDDENDQSATKDAFEVLHYIAAKRLAAGKLTVIDATNVQPEDRKPLVKLAREYHCLPVAIVLNLPEQLCHDRNCARPDRNFGSHVVRRQSQNLKRSLRSLQREGFRHIHILNSLEDVEAAVIKRQPLWNNRKHEHGPFDIIGDIHGCCDELEALLQQLGYERNLTSHPSRSPLKRERTEDEAFFSRKGENDSPLLVGEESGERSKPGAIRAPSLWGNTIYSHPQGRKAIFLGDLVDRGPRILDTLKLVHNMVEAGTALCVPGNHDIKLMRKLWGKNIKITHGLDKSLAEIDALPEDVRELFSKEIANFLDSLVSHYVLDDGNLVVSHAGMKEALQGRGSGKVRDFALYGETTGETDEFGLPVRYNWAAEYRGKAMVAYGHTPVPEPEWLNGTIDIDTGCVYGGKLTALRYPEKEFLSVLAAKVYCESAKPFVPDVGAITGDGATTGGLPLLSVQQQLDDVLDIADVLGKRLITTQLHHNVTIREENAIAALEVMSRFAANPKWLIYLPPTMSPCETSMLPELLEHPAEAFSYYRNQGVTQVICEEKHMGSRAVVIVCRNEDVARSRFGVVDEGIGICYTRTGRRFFENSSLEIQLLERLQAALTTTSFWDEFNTDWVCLDCELMPWSAKAQELLRRQYAAVGASSNAALPEAVTMLEQAAGRGIDVGSMLSRYKKRSHSCVEYVNAYRRYCWQVDSVNDLKLAPFHILATEGAIHIDKNHLWHMDAIAKICQSDTALFQVTAYQGVNVNEKASQEAGIQWWEELTRRGGEGMVVKPLDFVVKGQRGLVQPAVKCRGREYLRIIYGPEYTAPENLERLRQRGLSRKRSLALREFALGIEALERFVAKEPLRRVHECVFGILALESEPIDPRL
ncbi:polynucleotide kinase-phosphatase [Allocoleopsis franciscana]|uniref:Polynucleotide 3'-phosphatase n=1 Tax=Allocoleopsis franciscana PCC 7113 TaxID=1173027 RepID=K9WP66_9CYAN|nr:polynucleotide kinase-phosphatase [Allocoleopsis franciscana]AFZ21347.1 polynucleotide 3'-phosphatase [Allocoleopsis franciscana PCC 7113]